MARLFHVSSIIFNSSPCLSGSLLRKIKRPCLFETRAKPRGNKALRFAGAQKFPRDLTKIHETGFLRKAVVLPALDPVGRSLETSTSVTDDTCVTYITRQHFPSKHVPTSTARVRYAWYSSIQSARLFHCNPFVIGRNAGRVRAKLARDGVDGRFGALNGSLSYRNQCVSFSLAPIFPQL